VKGRTEQVATDWGPKKSRVIATSTWPNRLMW